MSWSPIGAIELTSEWQFIPMPTGDLFRVRHQYVELSGDRSTYFDAVLCQAWDDDGVLSIWDFRRLSPRPEADLIRFTKLPLSNRKLAARRIDGTAAEGWTIGLERWDGAEISEGATVASYERTFTQQDLEDGLLSLAHNLGNRYPSGVVVWDAQDVHITPDSVQSVDDNTLQISLASYLPITGTWRVSVTP